MQYCDLAVVGGSFAGLACATTAAQAGLDTRVLERKITPGAYTQSTGIFVKEIAEKVNLPADLCQKISGVRLYAPNMQFVDLYSRDYYFIATDTRGVLSWMADSAVRAGVEICPSTSVDQVQQQSNTVILPNQELSARYLVAADGADSGIARQLELGLNSQCLIGAEYETDGFADLADDKLHVFLSNRYAPGYIGWLIKGVETVQIGVAAKPGVHLKLRPFFEFLKVYFGSDAKMISGRGGRIPCGGVVSPWARDNVCLLGDAAGMVSPLTAGGIHPGIEIGELLGASIADYIHNGGDLPQQQIAPFVKRYPYKKRLRSLYNQMAPSDTILNWMINNPAFQRMAQIIFFHNRGLLSKAVWRDILFAEAYSG